MKRAIFGSFSLVYRSYRYYNGENAKKGLNDVYITVKEAADLLSVSETYVDNLIKHKKVRAVYDGEQYLLFKEQFNSHLKQMEKYLKLVEELQSEPIPEDIDVKDED
jgi:excisionase family DNA binding protein